MENMNNTNELVQQAQQRKFTDFDSTTKSILQSKVAEKLQDSGYFNRLNVAKGIVEAEDSEYQKYFKGMLKKAGVKSPDDFETDDEKKKFFNDVEKGWTKEEGA